MGKAVRETGVREGPELRARGPSTPYARLRCWYVLALVVVSLTAGCRADPAVVENNPPDLQLDTAAELEHVIGEAAIRITATAVDPDGGLVHVRVHDAPERANFQAFDNIGIFTWDPLASDVRDEPHVIVFVAEDDRGETFERSVRISVLPGNGMPRFLNTPSIIHNVDSGNPVAFDVRVRDDDSEEVTLRMPAQTAPEGASFSPTGKFTGRFSWTPTDEQMKHRVHMAIFVAEDGQNEPVEQKVSIYLKKSSDAQQKAGPGGTDGNCAFEAAVRYEPLGPQRGTDDYEITAELTMEAARKYDRLVLNWSSEDVFNDFSVQLEGSQMSQLGRSFTGKIPNPLLPETQSQIVYYQICAIDDDSTEDDAVLCGPTNIFDSFVAYSPDGASTCVDDEVANDSFESATVLQGDLKWLHHRTCADTADYFALELAPGQSGDVVFTYPRGQGLEVEMFDSNEQALVLEPSDCAGFTYAYLQNKNEYATTYYFRVSGDEVPYQVSPYLYQVELECADSFYEPNDTKDSASIISGSGEPLSSQEICDGADRDIYSVFAFAGDIIDARLEFEHDDGDLDLKLYAPSDADGIDTNGLSTAWSGGFSDTEEITYVATETGTHYLLVFGYGRSNSYVLTVDAREPESCEDADEFQGNHTQADAAPVIDQDYMGLSLCPSNPDWFEFMTFENETVTFEVEVTAGDLDAVEMELYDGTTKLESATRNGSRKAIVYSFSQSKRYQIVVRANAPTTYDFLISAQSN